MGDDPKPMAIAIAVTAVVMPILTLLCTKGVHAILQWRKDRREDREQERKGDLEEESIAIEVYRKVVEQLTSRVASLEQQIVSILAAHAEQVQEAHAIQLECVRDKEQLRGEMNVLREQLERLQAHDRKNEEHKKGLDEEIKKLETKIEGKTP